MSFLAAGFLWALPLIGGIVLMYMLKLKRRRMVVPSTLLWRRSVQDLIANSPLQKLRNNLLMYLQILALAAIIFALARPIMRMSRTPGETLVLMVDQSASMATREAGGRTRLEIAKQRAIEAVDALDADGQALVVAFSNRTQVVQSLTGDKALLRTAIASIRESDTEVSLAEAALILQNVTTKLTPDNIRVPRGDARTLLISDGSLGAQAERLADVGTIEYVRVGEETDNIGITAIDVRDSFTAQFEQQLFASVANSSDSPARTTVELKLGDRSIDIKPVEVPARGTASVVFTLPPQTSGIATVSLPADTGALPTDKVARAVVAPPRELTILIVTRGNFFLEQALSADPRVRVSRIGPADYATLKDEYDLTIFDNCTAGTVGTGMFVFINELPPQAGYSFDGEIENPIIIDWNRVHPLMRFVNMDRVLIGKARRIKPPRDAVALVEAEGTDIISYLETESRRFLVIGFDIFKSYWPVDVSFPIFVANIVEHARRQGGLGGRAAFATGTTIPITAPRDARKVVVTTPDERRVELEFAGGTTAFLTETSLAGIYRAQFDDGTRRDYAVNLSSESESNIRPAATLEVGPKRVLTGSDGPLRLPTEVWKWLALAAFLILAVEWYIYCRRMWL